MFNYFRCIFLCLILLTTAACTANPPTPPALPAITPTNIEGLSTVTAETAAADTPPTTAEEESAPPTPIPFVATPVSYETQLAQDLVPCTTTAIYASPQGSDDEGDGTAANPYYSLERAVTGTSPGTVICVQAGTYTAAKDEIGAQGTAEQPIIIQPVPGEKVIFDGTGADIGPTENIIAIHGAKHVIFQGFEVQNSTGRGISVYEAENITIRYNHLHDITTRAIGGGGDHIIIEHNEIWNSVLENEGNAYRAVGGWAAAIGTWTRADGSPSEDVIIRHNVVHEVWGEGIMGVKTVGIVIENNVIFNPYSVGIYANKIEDARINANHIFITDGRFNRSDRLSPAHGIMLANENTSQERPNLKNLIISNNLIVGTTTGIRYWHDPQSLVMANTYQDVQIVYNTIYNTYEEAIQFEDVPELFNQPTNITLHNNILYAGQNGRALSLGDPGAWTISHNNWPNGIPSQAGEPNSIAADPLFIAPQNQFFTEGFQIQEGSPVLGQALPIPEMTTDFWGNQRADNPTIGFAEHAVP